MNTNYFTGKKDTTANPNVPDGVEIIATESLMSGEIVYTYYLQRYNIPHPKHGGWAFWKVCDWVGSVPTPTSFEEIEGKGLI